MEQNLNNKIIFRKYYAVKISLASPICISSGLDESTDADVLVNGDGEVFVPGTSLAGAMRNYLELKKDMEEKDGTFGYSAGENGRMSAVFISDLYFSDDEEIDGNGDPVISVRDGIALTDEKQVKKGQKFDMQIIETGAQGIIYLNYLLREGDTFTEEIFEQQICDIFFAIQNGRIRIGAKKNRGFGCLRIERIYEKEFNLKSNDFDLSGWIKFKKNAREISCYGQGISFENWGKGKNSSIEDRYFQIRVPLKLVGGISIRKYSTKPGEADYEQITCNSKPVIPGSSWNGAIRADVRDILSDLGMDNESITKILYTWFGYVSQKKKSQKNIGAGTSESDGANKNNENEVPNEPPVDMNAEQSRVVIGESEITGATAVPMTRVSINRFDASAKDGALYSEISYFGGNTELNILVRKDGVGRYGADNHDWEALVGILDFVIQDIQDGYVAIGGQTSVGRGIFAPNPDKSIEYSEEISIDTCRKKIFSLL